MPAEAALEGAKEWLRDPAEVRLFNVAILEVIRDAVREDVFDLHAGYTETVAFEQLAAFAARICVRHGTTGLRFGVFGDEFGELPELAFAFAQQNPADFVGTTMVDHDFDGCAGATVFAELVEDRAGVGGMVNDAERVDEIVRLDGKKAAELLGVARAEADAIFEAENGGAPASQLHGFLREIDGRDLSARASEVYGVRADSAADFENFFATPTLELGESGDVIFDEVFAGFYLVEVFPGADRGGGMTDVARTGIPVVADARDFDVTKGHGESIQCGAFAG